MFNSVEEYIEHLKRKKEEHRTDYHWIRYDMMLTAVYEVLSIQSKGKEKNK
ncbi:hypothetical protein [Metabacillus sp. Hm71]|uniref:hypothetical protein n=1 Tax=Metabacillus sp. Hm71 TaxID=3450743 RepID=UPI003F41B962